MKTVFITGIAGFLGRHICRHFAELGWRVAGVDHLAPENVQLGTGIRYAQLKLPAPELAAFVRALEPDATIHCAGRASVPLSLEDPAADFRDNTVLTFELLDLLRKQAPASRFVLLSSAAIYGNPATLPVTEAHPAAPLSPYGFHKHQCELLCRESAEVFGMETLSVRIFSAYGPGLRRQVIWDICSRLLSEKTLTLHGTGDESRDFIHAADVARGIAALVDGAAAHGEVYNLAAGEETTIRELAEQLIRILGVDTEVEFNGETRAGDPLNWRADISKASALGFQPAVPLQQGLTQVATWCRAGLGL